MKKQRFFSRIREETERAMFTERFNELCRTLQITKNTELSRGLHCAPSAHRFLGSFPDGAVRVSIGPWTTAQELGINVLYGGHYKTEQFGIQALAENVSKKFKIPWSFLDDPSGL